jgi:CheY-like chemotaxis protein
VSDFTAERPVVLIVEDDFFIRMKASEMIGDAGFFDSVEAASAKEALAILEVRLDIGIFSPTFKCPARWMA